MRILMVVMPNSIHVARWVNQLSGQGWEIHLFSSCEALPHPSLRNVTLYNRMEVSRFEVHPSVRVVRLPRSSTLRGLSYQLGRLIDRLKPDLIHSMELQHAGYLTLDARAHVQGPFPRWIVSNWGSDIYLFGRLPRHEERIRQLLRHCDYYGCECARDVLLARQFGFRGEVLPVLPIAGGFDLEAIAPLRSPGPTSGRRLVVLKGYQHWAGRALVGLRALENCAAELQGYRVAVYGYSEDVALAAELFDQATGVPVDLITAQSHDDMLRLFGRARVYIGLSISDGISTALLEALAMGAFPIQSCTACADEWVADGETGFLVPPEDPQVIATALRRALSDDALVDEAAARNDRTCRDRLDNRNLAFQIADLYRGVISGRSRVKLAQLHEGSSCSKPCARAKRGASSPLDRLQPLWLRARQALGAGHQLQRAVRRHGLKVFIAKLLTKVAARLQRLANNLVPPAPPALRQAAPAGYAHTISARAQLHGPIVATVPAPALRID
jgi:glycosyltransferase involved in cell wall biosynthesis